MKLYLMRHGEAEPFKQDDASRALTQTGRAAVAAKLRHLEAVDSLIVSPYLRALQTADILVSEGLDVKRRVVDERVTPDSPLDPIVNILIDRTAEHQLIVAHNPLLSRLVRLLCGDDARGVSLATAEVACLESDDFLPGLVHLKWVR
jgi:phosphohistidine phosphatase SixA